MSAVEDATKLIGQIKVVEIEDLEDGSCRVIFDYDEKFKNEYKRLFALKRWSKKHFERQLDNAIANFAEQMKTDAGFSELRQQILKIKED